MRRAHLTPGSSPGVSARHPRRRAHSPTAGRGPLVVPLAVAFAVVHSVASFADPYEVAKTADAVVLMTEWNAYRGLDLERVRDSMRGRVFVDLRNVYEPGAMRALGFRYCGVGR